MTTTNSHTTSKRPTRSSNTLKRRSHDWIRAFEKYTENSESPRMFHTWAACSTLAAAMQRRCYMRWGHDTIYPNLYVVLVGPSGRVRKGDPINIARSFVTPLRLPTIGEDNTPEYIIRFMRESATNFTDQSTGKVCQHSSVTCFVEELSVLTGERNTKFLAYLDRKSTRLNSSHHSISYAVFCL